MQNSTIWRIKEIIGAKLELDPILIKLEKVGLTSAEYKDCENSKNLRELKITNDDKFTLTSKMISSMILKLNLLFSDQTLTPEAKNLFAEIFNKFTEEDGYMTRRT